MTDTIAPNAAPAIAAPAARPTKQAPWVLPALPLLAIASVLIAAPRLFPTGRAISFLVVGGLLAVALALVGWLINHRPIGAFIDNRNRLSLSKLQAGAWTVIVIAALSTAAAFNAVQISDHGAVTALDITIPGELLLAMGISATSLVAAPALLSLKANETSSDAAIAALDDDASPLGKVVVHDSPQRASWANLVTGDEVGNASSPDLSKIQQLLISLLLLGCYAGYIFANFSEIAGPITKLPGIDQSFVWLLGLSHASYLAYKAAPHTATGSSS